MLELRDYRLVKYLVSNWKVIGVEMGKKHSFLVTNRVRELFVVFELLVLIWKGLCDLDSIDSLVGLNSKSFFSDLVQNLVVQNDLDLPHEL